MVWEKNELHGGLTGCSVYSSLVNHIFPLFCGENVEPRAEIYVFVQSNIVGLAACGISIECMMSHP